VAGLTTFSVKEKSMADEILMVHYEESNETFCIELMERNVAKSRREWMHRWKCFCGNSFVCLTHRISSGRKKSCGCHKSKGKQRMAGGVKRHPLYSRWAAMVQRCTNEKSPKYSRYGGRGIRVCDEWLNSSAEYIRYVEAELGPQPTKDHSIDRIDNNADYKPGNIRWANSKQQGMNRDVVRHEWDGAVVNRKRVWARINRDGWDVEEAVKTPGKANG
jgi:hypothetical protein